MGEYVAATLDELRGTTGSGASALSRRVREETVEDKLGGVLGWLEEAGPEALQVLDQRIARKREEVAMLERLRRVLAPARAAPGGRTSGTSARDKVAGLTPLQLSIARHLVATGGKRRSAKMIAQALGEREQGVIVSARKGREVGFVLDGDMIGFTGTLPPVIGG